jgi:hypothetical protein
MTAVSESTYEAAFATLAAEKDTLTVNAASAARKCLDAMQERNVLSPRVNSTANGGVQFEWVVEKKDHPTKVSLMVIPSARIVEYQIAHVDNGEFDFYDVDPRDEDQFEAGLQWLDAALND